MKQRILVLGYGIDDARKEAISLNTGKLIRALTKLGMEIHLVNIGYEGGTGVHFGKSMKDALIHRRRIIEEVNSYITDNQITHVTDVFALPGASVAFTLPILKRQRRVKFIKEIQNDSGHSSRIQTETIIRLIFNREKSMNRILNSFDVSFTRNLHLAQKRKLIYLPPEIEIYPERKFKGNRVIRLSYLGHPLKKKGIEEFPKVFKSLPERIKKLVRFDFAFSNLGNKENVKIKFSTLAKSRNIKVRFHSIVKPHIFFRDSDVYILPIRDEFGAASTPNTVLEAMEAGALVLVNKIESLEGVIEDKENGLYLSSPDAEGIIAGIKFVLENPKEVKKMVNAARKRIVEKYSADAADKTLEKIYA